MSTVILDTNSISELNLIIELARKLDINVLPLSEMELEEIEDLKLLRMMLKAKEEGLADTKETLAKLGITN